MAKYTPNPRRLFCELLDSWSLRSPNVGQGYQLISTGQPNWRPLPCVGVWPPIFPPSTNNWSRPPVMSGFRETFASCWWWHRGAGPHSTPPSRWHRGAGQHSTLGGTDVPAQTYATPFGWHPALYELPPEPLVEGGA